jgi:D-3-phosphoglycerate dehydrogenase
MPIDRDIMVNCPNLKAVVRSAIGYEILDVEAATELNIPICNIPSYCVEEVATHTLALLLAAERKVCLSEHLVRRGEWKRKYGYPIHRLSRQTLGIVGLGRIGKRVAKYAHAFDMRVIAYDPYCQQETFDELNVVKVTLDELLAKADAIALNAPLTDDNYHLVNKDSIAKMKDGVIIVNTGRGPLVSTVDLIEGVKSGKIKAAALDVLEEEPLRNPEAEILKFDNVIVTSHIAHDSVQSSEELFNTVVDTILQILSGELPSNVLNKNSLQKS